MPPRNLSSVLFLIIPVLATSATASSYICESSSIPGIWVQAEVIADEDSVKTGVSYEDTAVVQQKDTVITDSVEVDSVIIEPDIRGFGPDSILIDSYAVVPADSVVRRSPTLALFKSVVFPGWGQYSNCKYVKAVLVFGLESYLIYKAIDLGREASDWKDMWRGASDELKSEYFRVYSDFRDRRNSHIWYTALTIFLSMFDAYVDAHLAPFPKDIEKAEEVTLEIETDEELRLNLIYHF